MRINGAIMLVASERAARLPPAGVRLEHAKGHHERRVDEAFFNCRYGLGASSGSFAMFAAIPRLIARSLEPVRVLPVIQINTQYGA
jgi:hypothetical protein